MALMAGILFTATFLVFGISTFVSPARIYPPNEGKVVVGGKELLLLLLLQRTSDFISPPIRVSVFALHSVVPPPGSCKCVEFKGEKTATVTFYAATFVEVFFFFCPRERMWNEKWLSKCASAVLVSDRAASCPGAGRRAAPIRADLSVRREGQDALCVKTSLMLRSIM